MGKFTDISIIVETTLKEITSKENLRIIGEEAKRLIQRRTRLGGGVDKSLGNRTRLKPLSGGYKKQRKRLRRRNQLSGTTTPAKSNLTQTGGMLRDIGVKVSSGRVSLRFISAGAKKKAKWVQDAGRKFFHISKPEFNQLQKSIRKRVEAILNKIK